MHSKNRAAWITVFVYSVVCLNSGLVGNAQTNFSVLAQDGAWTWYNDPRALFHNGVLYFGYVRYADGRGVLSAINTQTGARTDLWSSVPTQKDDHNNPGLLVKEDGKMLAIYARHGSDPFFSYRLSTSTNPVNPSDWSDELTMTNTTSGVTYSNPYQLLGEGGRVYNFMRNLNFNPTVLTSTNGGANWSTPQLFIKNGAGSIRPYVKYASDNNQRIDFLYTDGHPRDITNSLYHLYYQSNAFYNTEGVQVKSFSNLPILHDSGERGSVIYQYSDSPSSDPNDHIPTGRAWCWETGYQTNGQPVCAFTVQRDQVTGTNWFDDRIYYYYGVGTGTNWQKRFIAHAGRPLYQAEDDYAGGICIDPKNPSVIYISSNAQNPFDLSNTTNVALKANERYEIYRGTTTDGGLTFSWEAITTNSAVDNLRPYIPRRQSGTSAVIWFRGNYTTFTTYNCEIVGLFPNPIPEPLAITLNQPSVSPIAVTNLNNELKLVTELTDDDLPQPAMISWTTVSGPTNAIFSDPNQLTTTAQFPSDGIYVLRVTADDTISTRTSEITVAAGAGVVDGSGESCSLRLDLNALIGSSAVDSSGSSNNGTLSGGTTWRVGGGIRGGAIELDGVSGQIIVPDADNLDNAAAFTLSFWFLARTYPIDSAGLVSKRNGIADNNAYTTYLKNDHRIYIDLDGSNNRFASTSLINTGQWYHVVITFDGSVPSAQRVKLWINGKLDTVASESSSFIPNYTSSVRIGNTHSGATNWFNGFMDEIRIYRRVLPVDEIGALAVSTFSPSISFTQLPLVTNRLPALIQANVVPGNSTNAISSFWNHANGLGNVVVSNLNSPTTWMNFDKAGGHTMKLEANDQRATVVQRVNLLVAPNTNVFEDWTKFFFLSATNQSVVGPNADPDGDGICNLYEFSLGMNPTNSDAVRLQNDQAGLPFGSIVSVSETNYLALTFRRPIGRFDVAYEVKVSGNLIDWTNATLLDQVETGGGTSEVLTFRDFLPINQAPCRFMRLNVIGF